MLPASSTTHSLVSLPSTGTSHSPQCVAFPRCDGKSLKVSLGKAGSNNHTVGKAAFSGEVDGNIQASASVTFFRLKPGHLLLPGRALCGRLVLADIGLSERALAAIAPKAFVNAPAIWRDAAPRLDAFAHKYTRGAALVVSGPAHRTGAARLAARAALRVGAGLATIASPPDAVAANAAQSTAVMVTPFADLAGFARLLADPRRNAVLIGPGAGVGEATRGLVAALKLASLLPSPSSSQERSRVDSQLPTRQFAYSSRLRDSRQMPRVPQAPAYWVLWSEAVSMWHLQVARRMYPSRSVACARARGGSLARLRCRGQSPSRRAPTER